ncbi:GNAT family N-acetyltransferase [Streptomyces sp. NPDC060194]|uniref:GNAT family N-acetyltransferase n=1 Tax=Streptomyces sp. NPDC060194 TaxID=3347069 RepID=UPI00366180BB
MPPVTRPTVRPVRAEEWREVKALRLLALRDPAAPIAFLETYEEAAARPDDFYRQRAEGASHGTGARQFVAEDGDGSWVGSVTVLVEEAGRDDFFGHRVERRQAQLVGVYLRPEHRGTGVLDALVSAAVAWAWSDPAITRVRLHVHESNARAAGAYRRLGFVASGVTLPTEADPALVERELVLARPTAP